MSVRAARDTRAQRISSCGKKVEQTLSKSGAEVIKAAACDINQERARKKSSQSTEREHRTIINSKRKKHTKLLCCSRWCYQQVVKLISSSGEQEKKWRIKTRAKSSLQDKPEPVMLLKL
jgi:ectoine hydroxylase-related dioxygenase (phytanoyl-CoA dioxygenase family)